MKKRLDVLLVEKGLSRSREEAQAFILAGEVWSGERRLEKAGMSYPIEMPIEVRSEKSLFVSRAGHKLDHFLETHHIQVAGKVAIDVGASTGGFTDCLLKRGAKHIFSVDVGYGQLDSSLRNHPQVTNLEKLNARYLTTQMLLEKSPLAEAIEMVVMDLSFISLAKVIPAVKASCPGVKCWVFLFKPQFEVGPEFIGKGGLVRSEEAVQKALIEFEKFLKDSCHLTKSAGPDAAVISGKKSGNLEYLLYYTCG